MIDGLASSMGRMTSDHSFRIAIKDGATNNRMIEILRSIISH